jgi:RNA polymerase sigma-70 factor (ECF subfamily)
LSLCIDAARQEFDAGTVEAFELYAVKQVSPADVAKKLGISRNAVYIAKSRVLGRLRELMADFDAELSP